MTLDEGISKGPANSCCTMIRARMYNTIGRLLVAYDKFKINSRKSPCRPWPSGLLVAYDKFKINSLIRDQKNLNINGPNIFSRDKNLKPYVPKLKEVGGNHHRLCFEYLDKGDIEHQFARLIATRQNELFQSAVLIIGFSYSMAAIPIMRAFSDTLFLLKYVEINPKYILRFMGKAGGGIRIDQIKNEIDDLELINYYSELSNLMHANPVSIKYTYQKVGSISFLAPWPLDAEKLNEWHVTNLIRHMEESNRIITDLYSKNWKPEKHRPKD